MTNETAVVCFSLATMKVLFLCNIPSKSQQEHILITYHPLQNTCSVYVATEMDRACLRKVNYTRFLQDCILSRSSYLKLFFLGCELRRVA